MKDHNEAFEDVSLGPLLGQGGFGKVYRGLWNGAAVAVKVKAHRNCAKTKQKVLVHRTCAVAVNIHDG